MACIHLSCTCLPQLLLQYTNSLLFLILLWFQVNFLVFVLDLLPQEIPLAMSQQVHMYSPQCLGALGFHVSCLFISWSFLWGSYPVCWRRLSHLKRWKRGTDKFDDRICYWKKLYMWVAGVCMYILCVCVLMHCLPLIMLIQLFMFWGSSSSQGGF